MKIGLIGLPQTGKKTLFNLLTGENLSSENLAGGEIKIGTAHVRDERFDQLVRMYQPQKSVPATIDVVLLPKVDQDTIKSGEFLKAIEKCDALCHLVRAFTDESVFHVKGNVDPLRDIENVYSELILNDLILVEKRLERLEKELKSNPQDARKKEKDILERMKKTLDENLPLTIFELSADEQKLMSTYQFVTRRPMLIVLNVDDGKISDATFIDQIQEKYKDYHVSVMQVSAKIESELTGLSEEERAEFLKDLNIKSSALNQLSTLYYEALGLISFFTVGKDEVRAWAARRGSSAPEAAGAIHSDLQRGFIRAEIMKCPELLDAGGEAKLKEQGKVYLKGKDYTVEDGDIMHVRFNV